MSKPTHSTTHPLDVVPLFRLWPPSVLRDLIYTALWNAMLALIIVTISRFINERPTTFWQDMAPSLLIANVVGFLIHGSLMAGNRLLGDWLDRTGRAQRLSYLVALVALCAMLGISIGTAILRGVNPWQFFTNPASAVYLLRFGLVTACYMFIIFMMGERRIARDTLAAQQREQIANAAQLVAEARLRALQAQIEPHFLYNTLANVLGLIETDPIPERYQQVLKSTCAPRSTPAAPNRPPSAVNSIRPRPIWTCWRCAWARACATASKPMTTAARCPSRPCCCSPSSKMPSRTAWSRRWMAARSWSAWPVMNTSCASRWRTREPACRRHRPSPAAV